MQLIYDNSFHVSMNPLAFVQKRFMFMHTHGFVCAHANRHTHTAAHSETLILWRVGSIKVAHTHRHHHHQGATLSRVSTSPISSTQSRLRLGRGEGEKKKKKRFRTATLLSLMLRCLSGESQPQSPPKGGVQKHPAALVSPSLYSSWGSIDTDLSIPTGYTTVNTITEQDTLR